MTETTLSFRLSKKAVKQRYISPCSWTEELCGIIKKLDLVSKNKSWEKISGLRDINTLKAGINFVTETLENELRHLDEEQLKLFIEELLNIYLTLKRGNPYKASILSLISLKSKREECPYLNSIFSQLFEGKLLLDYSVDSLRECADLLNCLNSCIEENPQNVVSAVTSAPLIIKLLDNLISKCLSLQMKDEISHVAKEDVLNNLHSLTQQCIILLQKIPSCDVPNDFLISCLNYIRNTELPLNTKFTISIILSLANKFIQTINLIEVAEEDLSSCPLSSVSICSGILSSGVTPNAERLTAYPMILNILLAVEKRHSSDCKLTLAVSRSISVFTKSVLLSGNPDILKDILDPLLKYIISHIDHHMDAVRHLATDALNNTIQLLSKCKARESLELIVLELSDIPSHRRSKYSVLSFMIGHIPVEELLLNIPNIPELLFSAVHDSSGAKHVIFCLEKIISHHYNECSQKETWMKVWIDPLLKSLQESNGSAMEKLMGEALKLNPDILNYVFNLPSELLKNKMKIIMICLKMSQKVGLLKDHSEDKWKGVVPYSVLAECMHHRDDDMRLNWFALIVESPKSTCRFTETEIQLLLRFFEHNVHNQYASFRQSFISTFKKFLLRINNSLAFSMKAIINYENRPPEATCSDICDEYRTLEYYKMFKSDIASLCCENLFEGASFSRRNTILQMLTLLQEFDLLELKDISCSSLANRLIIIIACDTYEENKRMAKLLLRKFPLDKLRLGKTSSLQKEVDRLLYGAIVDCFKFVSSIKPPDSVSAAYCLASILQLKDTESCVQYFASTHGFSSELSKLYTNQFCILNVISKALSGELLVASLDLAEAAKTGPMYGLLFMARHILGDVNLKEINMDDGWHKLIKELIKLAIGCSKAVGCVVNNSSPEGHLPMDLDKGYATCLSLKDSSHQITSQLLLLCAWRTVKEVCLLLGEIVEHIIIALDDDGVHFCARDVIEIGEHFTTLLSEIKHRGAFEQTYIGFCKLTSVLWKYQEGELHNLPSKWLNDTLEEISSNQKLCATRRSAGIPFIILALVCTEREMLQGKYFESTINRLISFGSNRELSSEARIHSMNILRSLFRNKQLGELVSPYVADGFIVAFNSFSSRNFPEKNAATLLFTALMTRVFGVLRSKSFTLNWKNKMTSRIFFQRYPSLYGVMLDKLNEASETNIQTVLPILLLLGRLYPSSLEGTDSILELHKFIPFVNKCAESKIMVVRNLAASALVGLLTPNDICQQIALVLNTLGSAAKENHFHGLLLQVLQLVKFGSELSEESLSHFNDSVKHWFNVISNIFLNQRHSLIVRASCLQILHLFVLRHSAFLEMEKLYLLRDEVMSLLTLKLEVGDPFSIGFSNCVSSGVISLVAIAAKESPESVVQCLSYLLSVHSYEILQSVMDVILSFLDDELEPASDDITIVLNSLKDKEIITRSIKHSSEISDKLMNSFSADLHHEDLFKILLCAAEMPDLVVKLVYSEGGVVALLKKYFLNGRTEMLKSACLSCATYYLLIKPEQLTIADGEIISEVIMDSVSLDYCCRIAGAKFVTNLYHRLINNLSQVSTIYLWTAILHFLCDDSVDVRDIMCTLISNDKVDAYLTLQRSFELFEKTSPNKLTYAAALTGWSMAPFVDSGPSLPDNEQEKAFDKGDTNTYKEDLLIAQLCTSFLQKISLDQDAILEVELPEDLKAWLSNIQDPYPDMDNKYRGAIYGILCDFTMTVSDELELCNTGYRYFKYFSPSFSEISLRIRKDGFLYKVNTPSMMPMFPC